MHMNKKSTQIFMTTLATIVCIAVLAGVIACSQRQNLATCTELKITIKDSLEYQHVTTDELHQYLMDKGQNCLGFEMEGVSCINIEECLSTHDMIRTVNCYKTPFNSVRVKVTQRQPVLKVKSGNVTYYVDSDRKVMPYKSSIAVEVPTFTGAVGENMATSEYYDFVKWLQSNPYWGKRIHEIHVHHPKYLILTQQDYDAKIILGELHGYEEKLARLEKLYTKGFDIMGYPQCKELDLRFNGQIVRR